MAQTRRYKTAPLIPLNDEQRALVESNIRLAYKAANVYCRARWYLEIDECVQVASIAMIRAAVNYDASFGAKFSTFAYSCAMNALMNYGAGLAAAKRTPERDRMTEEYRELSYAADPMDLEEEYAASELLAAILRKFPMMEELIRLRAEGLTMREIGEIQHCSGNWVQLRLEKVRAYAKMEAEICKRF